MGDNCRVVPTEESAVELLRRVPLFTELDEEELDRFSRVAVGRSYPKATRVFHEGDHSDACYIVRTGSFRVTREHSDGRAITLYDDPVCRDREVCSAVDEVDGSGVVTEHADEDRRAGS